MANQMSTKFYSRQEIKNSATNIHLPYLFFLVGILNSSYQQRESITCSKSGSDSVNLSIILTSSSDVYGLRSSFKFTGVDNLLNKRGFLGGVLCKRGNFMSVND